MKRQSLIVMLLLAVTCTMTAKPRTAAQLRQEAAKVLSTTTMAKGLHGNVAAEPEVLNQKSQLTVLGYKDGGYAVIANDDEFAPVLGYSDAKLADEHAPAFLWWMDAINTALEKKLADGEQPERVRPAAEYKERVDELLTTRWNQDAPFNNMCPTYTKNGKKYNYVTGCVATAMAQIMYYHKYPVKGSGHYSYTYIPEGGNGTVRPSANFETTYDYDNMLPVYTPGNYTQVQADAVAKLMYHCGVSVEMNYTTTGSGAFSANACQALRKYFLYDENIKLYTRDIFPVDEWMSIVYRELNDGCPILYGGQSSSGGHSFVLDGYDENGLVHVNWGWGGTDNGFFDIAELDGYNYGQDMVTVRMPNDPTFDSTYRSMWGFGHQLTATKSGSYIVLGTESVYNIDVDDFTGKMGVMAQNTTTGEAELLALLGDESTFSAIGYLSGLKFNNAKVPFTSLPNGTYRIYLATMSERETEWQPIRSKEDVNNSYILVKNGSSATLQAENNSNWTTAIDNVPTVEKPADNRIYSIDGRYLGTDPSTLKKGIYIMNGKKFMK